MVTSADIIHFNSILSLINGSYLGIENECLGFISPLDELEWLIDSLNFRFRGLKDADSFRQIRRSAQGRIKDICLNSILNREAANEICEVYQEVKVQLEPLKDNCKGDNYNHLLYTFKAIERNIELLYNSANLENDDTSGNCQIIENTTDRHIKADKLIIESLTSFFICAYLYCDDYNSISQSLKNISNRLISSLQPHGGLLPEDILHVMNHLPQSLYQGFFYYLMQSNNIDARAYTELVTAVKSNNLAVFSSIIFDHDLYQLLLLYYDILTLFEKSYVRNRSRTSHPKFRTPIVYLQGVRDYYAKYYSNNNQVTSLSKQAAVTVMLYREIKKIGTDEHIQLISNLINSDNVVRERFSLYERVSQWHSTHPSASTTENSLIQLQPANNGNSSAKESSILNEEFNCIMPEKDINSFLDYLAWRGYLKEGDQASFKYDVFGGHKPSDYHDNVSISDDIKIAAGTMFGVIIWQLRKEKNNPEYLYGKIVSQSNNQIGIGDESMRIFVDFSLFFPSLMNCLVMKNRAFEPIKKRLKERVQELSKSDDYKNCSSVLEFIQELEIRDRGYWVVSKELDD